MSPPTFPLQPSAGLPVRRRSAGLSQQYSAKWACRTSQRFAAAGRLIVGASGGAMQLTRNVSLFRLLSATVDAVVANRDEFGGLGIVGCEILPHLDKHDASFLEKVRKYSELVLDEIVAVEDGGALVVDDCGDFKCFGTAVRFRGRSPIEAAAAHPLAADASAAFERRLGSCDCYRRMGMHHCPEAFDFGSAMVTEPTSRIAVRHTSTLS